MLNLLTTTTFQDFCRKRDIWEEKSTIKLGVKDLLLGSDSYSGRVFCTIGEDLKDLLLHLKLIIESWKMRVLPVWMQTFASQTPPDFIFCPTISKTQMSKKSPKIGRFVFLDFFSKKVLNMLKSKWRTYNGALQRGIAGWKPTYRVAARYLYVFRYSYWTT